MLGDEALERLSAYADEHDSDVCLGKTGRRGHRPGGAALFAADHPDVASDALLLEALGSVKIYRKQFVDSRLREPDLSGVATEFGFALGAVAQAQRISVLANYAAAFGAPKPSVAGARDRLSEISGSSVPEELRQQAKLVTYRSLMDLVAQEEAKGGAQWEADVVAARATLTQHVPVEIDNHLGPAHRRLSDALRSGDEPDPVRSACQSARPSRPRMRNVDAAWSAGGLGLSFDLEQPEAEVQVAVFRTDNGTEWVVPEVHLDSSDDGQLRISCQIHPDVLAGGSALGNGAWRPALLLNTPEGSRRIRVPYPAGAGCVGFSGDRVVAVTSERGQLILDVGATRTPVVARLDPTRVTIVENARGSELSAPVPDLHLPADTELTGKLRIGDLPVPAVVRGSGSEVTLTAFLSGLAGSYPLATKFSRAQFAPAGVTLEVDGGGGMSVRRAPRPAPSEKPNAPGRQRGGATETSRLQTVEHAVRRFARRVPGARAVYRRVRPVAR